MSDDLASGNPGVSSEGNPQAGSLEVSNGTGTSNGEASQSATVQDSFIPEGVDINTLPPNVRAMVDKINKDMVRGFTEKTTKLSETTKSEVAKAVEAYKQKAEFYDSIASQEAFVNKWNEYVKEQEKSAQGHGSVDANGDPIVNQMKQELQEMKQKMQISEMSQITEAFAEAVNEKGEKLHPEFDALNNFSLGKIQNGNQAEEFSLLRASIELAPGKTPQEKLANGYKAAKATYDAIFEMGKKAGMGRLQTKALNGSLPPSNSTIEGLTTTDKKPKSAKEAMDLARRGVMVSRD